MQKIQTPLLNLILFSFGCASFFALFLMQIAWLKGLVMLVYGFVIPAGYLLNFLQSRFVGMTLRNKSIFLAPLFLPLLLLVSLPFWEYSRRSNVFFDWTGLIMAGIVVISTFLAARLLKQATLHFAASFWGILLLVSLGLFLGLLFGYWL